MFSKRVFSECQNFLKLNFYPCLKIRSNSILASTNIQIRSEDIEDEEWKNAKPFHAIPGPTVLPIVGSKWRILPVIGDFDFNSLHNNLRKMFNDFGPIVRLEKLIGKENIVLISDPNDIESLYRNEGIAPDRFPPVALEYYKNVTRREFFGNIGGVVGVDPEKWLKFRQNVSKEMLQPKIVKSYLNPIENVAKKFVKRIELITDNRDEVPQDFINEIAKWVLDSLSTFALDVDMGCLDSIPNQEVQEFIDATCTFEEAMAKLDLMPLIWKHAYTPTWIKFEKALDTVLATVVKYVNVVIDRGVNSKNKENFSLLERLLTKNADNPNVAFIAAFEIFITGIKTMKSSASFLFYHLSKNPEVQEKLYQEIRRVAPSYEIPLTNADIENMKYLKAFIKEVLRVTPPIFANGRRLTKNFVLRNYQVPKGTQIVFDILMPQTSEKYFKNAHKIEPERWLRDDAKENFEKIHPFSNIPYSFGKRACLGRRLANLQLYVLTCKMLQKYRIEYNHQDLEYNSSPFLSLNGALKFKFTER